MGTKKNVDDVMIICCASCGQAEIDDIRLKKCDGGCDLVKYCRDECQRNHMEQHEKVCKEKAAELRDRDLFGKSEGSYLGDCPICCLPLPLDENKSTMMPCCSKNICRGCEYANQMRENEEGLEHKCAFCREPVPDSREKAEKYLMKRIKKNDPNAMCFKATLLYDEGDYQGAFKLWSKAVGLGHAEAHHNLSCMYNKGQVVEKDKKKYIYHLEEGAIGGHPTSRYNLGCIEVKNGRFERARKHFIISANLGWNDSLKCVRQLYEGGDASKEDYAGALRGYQAAVDATKSNERKKAEKAFKSGEVWAIC